MKYLFTCLFAISMYLSYGQADNSAGIIKYGVNLNKRAFQKIDKLQKSDTPISVRRGIKRVVKNHSKIYASDIPFIELSFNKNSYISEPIDVMIPESLKGEFIFQNDVYYQNIKDDIHLKKFQKRGKTYIANLDINDKVSWTVKNEYKNILGFKCRKAVFEKKTNSKTANISLNNKYIAWFTPQMPINFVPVPYYGLPGAVLEITTSFKHIYAKSVEFKDDVGVEKPTDGIKLTAKEYKQMMSGFGSN